MCVNLGLMSAKPPIFYANLFKKQSDQFQSTTAGTIHKVEVDGKTCLLEISAGQTVVFSCWAHDEQVMQHYLSLRLLRDDVDEFVAFVKG